MCRGSKSNLGEQIDQKKESQKLRSKKKRLRKRKGGKKGETAKERKREAGNYSTQGCHKAGSQDCSGGGLR